MGRHYGYCGIACCFWRRRRMMVVGVVGVVDEMRIVYRVVL